MNVEEKGGTVNKRENRGCVFLRSQWEITGASPHAERMRYAEEYLISTFLSFSLCMKNKGIINAKTFCLFFFFFISATIKMTAGVENSELRASRLLCPVRMWRPLQDERVHCKSQTHCTVANVRNSSLMRICDSACIAATTNCTPNDIMTCYTFLSICKFKALISPPKNKEKGSSGNVHILASALQIWKTKYLETTEYNV